MFITRIFLLLLLACTSFHGRAQAPAVLEGDTLRVDVASHLRLLHDPSGNLNIETAATAPNWHSLPGPFNVGFTKDALWLHLIIERQPDAPTTWIFEVNNAVLDDLQLYHRDSSSSSWKQHRAGEDFARTTWDFSYRNPVFLLDFSSQGRHEIFLRVTSRNSISAQMFLWKPTYFSERSRDESLAYGLLFGTYLTILIIQFFFWLWTQEDWLGLYVLYVANSFGQMLLTFGYLQTYFNLSGFIGDTVLSLLICSSLWVCSKLFTYQLALHEIKPWLNYQFNRIMGWGSVITAMLAITQGYSYGVMPAQLIAIGGTSLLVIISIQLIWHRHRSGFLFLLAFGPFIIGIILRIMRNLTLLPPNFFTDNGYQIGAISHMLLMSLVLMNRFNQMKIKMTLAQSDALRIKTEQAVLLEKEVASRTAALSLEIKRCQALELELRESLMVEKQAMREQRDFVSMVSHEFRTPLTIIDTSTQRIAGTEISEANKERCKNIRQAARRMTLLMDEFLSLDRMDGHLRSFKAESHPMGAIIDNLMRDWDSGVLKLRIHRLPSFIYCDAKLLLIALRNLLANAVRHSDKKDPVHLHIYDDHRSGIYFEITNTGLGIPSDELPRLFQKYFRGRSTQDKPGAGLGLYIVERIAYFHKGEITFMGSNDINQFILKIPIINPVNISPITPQKQLRHA